LDYDDVYRIPFLFAFNPMILIAFFIEFSLFSSIYDTNNNTNNNNIHTIQR